MPEPHRLRAPKADGAILARPALEDALPLLERNIAQIGKWEHDFQGRNASRLRAMARSQVLGKAAIYLEKFHGESLDRGNLASPLIVTGHQPELFHPGVWIKNFAIAAIARQAGGRALNLIVDNDIPKSASLRVPSRSDGAIRAAMVDFDVWNGEVPYEDWKVSDESIFSAFGAQVRESLSGLVRDPLIDSAWCAAERTRKLTDRAGLRFSVARHVLEGEFGIRNAEVPLSEVCETEAFGWFASHILACLPRFRSTYNAALARYRNLYKIRSKNHPVPNLDREGDWLEAPFWVWRASLPRRRPLMVRQNAKTMDLRVAGEHEILGTLSLAPDRDACCAVEQLAELARQGIRIRTRALTTTMFARLLLGDLFIHGIGGAKYDELGDEVMRGFFGFNPPEYLTLSMTLWLGNGGDASIDDQIRANQRALRDVQYNPDRFLKSADDPRISEILIQKQNAMAGSVGTRHERVQRYRELRRANDALAPFVEHVLHELADERKRLEEARRIQTLATSREWPYVVHSREKIEQAVSRLLTSESP